MTDKDNKNDTTGYKKQIQQFVKDYPNWPRGVYATSLVPAFTAIGFPKRLNFKEDIFGFKRPGRSAVAAVGIGALLRLAYLTTVGEVFTPKKYTEKDILDNKAFLIASMANISGLIIGPITGFYISFASIGCEGAAIAFRTACVLYPPPIPEPNTGPNNSGPKKNK